MNLNKGSLFLCNFTPYFSFFKLKRPENIKRLRFLRKVQLFIMFFVLSSLVWLISSLSENSKKVIQVRIINDFQKTQNTNIFDLKTVDVQVNTSGFNLMYLHFFNKKLIINKSELIHDDGKNIYFLPNRTISYFQNQWKYVKIERFLDDTLYFSLDKIHFKKVPIKSEVDFKTKLGYLLDAKPQFRPDSILIFGDPIDLKQVKYVKTESKVFKDIQSNIQKTIALDKKFLQKYHLKTNVEALTIDISVSKFTEEVLELPIYVRNTSNTLVEIFPKKFKIKFLVKFEERKNIEFNQFQAEVLIPDNHKNNDELLPIIMKSIPNNIHRIEMEPQYVNYYIVR